MDKILLKRFTASFFVVFLVLMIASVQMHVPIMAASNVTIYNYPNELPNKFKSNDFQVTASGKVVDLYNAGTNSWGNDVTYGYFEFNDSTQVTISTNFTLGSYKLVPESLGIQGVKNNNTVTFTLSEPTKITLVPNDDYQGRVIHLFADRTDTNIPSASDPNVIYYGPGYYDLSAQTPTQISSGKTLYIAAGAVINGRFLAKDQSNITVRGRGILVNDYGYQNDGYDPVPLVFKGCSNVNVEDIIVNKNDNNWTAFMYESENVTVDNFKAVSPVFASTDGFDISSSHDVTFDNVFIHSADDCVAIKGSDGGSYEVHTNPEAGLPVYNIEYKNSQFWSDANCAIGIGAETQGSYFDNINFYNIDILYNFDDVNYPNVLDDRSAINIYALNGTEFSNITFDTIRVEKAKRLINIQMDDDFYDRTLLGDWSWPGFMTGITYRNITSTSDGSNEIKISGYNNQRIISDIKFENIVINNTIVEDLGDKHFNINPNVNNVYVDNDGIDENYSMGMDYSSTQGERQWYYLEWTGSTYNQLTWLANDNAWKGTNTWSYIWNPVIMHPDTYNIARAWKAPKSGKVRISGRVAKYNAGGGDGVNVKIMKNNQQVWPASGWKSISFDDELGYEHDFYLDVNSDDMIYFIVNQNGNNAYDGTLWDAAVTYDFVFDSQQSFSGNQGHEQWAYKYWDGSTLLDMQYNTFLAKWEAASWAGIWWNSDYGAGSLMHPDGNAQVIKEWTAPFSGTVVISGAVWKQNTSGGDGVLLAIDKNGSNIWPTNGGWNHLQYNDSTGYEHKVVVNVQAGDRIGFKVDMNGNSAYDAVRWAPVVCYQ